MNKSLIYLLGIFLSFIFINQARAISDSTRVHKWYCLGTGSSEIPERSKTVNCDVAVIGAGMSGISAAVAAARQGADVVLINDRPVLGGNASSEIRVTVNGVQTLKAKNPVERETGIIEEILLENKKYNPQESYPIWDHVLYDYVVRQPNLRLMLNTQAIKAIMDGERIKSAFCWQSTTETEVVINAKIFVDCSGDGLFAATSGAEYRTGREGKAEFGEKYAPDEPDGWMMGESIMMITKDMGRPVPFYPPSYTKKFDASKAVDRKIKNLKEGFWWVELGSPKDIIADREKNRHDLMAYFYGVWDYVKNSGEYPEAANLALEWVGSLPGKRESRRFMGDYILTEKDLLSYKHFDDAVAWGGWSLDEHCPGGILSLDQRPSYFHERFKKVYEIPYRCLYSKNVPNLMFAGRNVSVSHMALSSTRIIGTCCMMGQAVGVATAMCIEKNINPREIYLSYIDELQERMLRNDYYIPNRPANDSNDLTRTVDKVWATSTSSGDVHNLFDGVARDEENKIHHWQSDGLNEKLFLEWKKPVEMSSVEIKFDTNLHRKIMMHKNPAKNFDQVPGMPPELVKTFSVDVYSKGRWHTVGEITDNIKRFVPVSFPAMSVTKVRINLKETYGCPHIRLYEVRCY